MEIVLYRIHHSSITVFLPSISTIEENLERLKQKNEELREASNVSGISNEDAAQLDARINQNVATIEKLEEELNRL